jgi:hypothetical protein
MKRHKEGYKARLAESLGERHRGKHKESMAAREHESEAMEKKRHGHEFEGVRTMDEAYKHHMAHAHHKYHADHHRKSMHKSKKR